MNLENQGSLQRNMDQSNYINANIQWRRIAATTLAHELFEALLATAL